MGLINDFPQSAVTATSGDVAAASAVATLPAVAGMLTYITGFEITGGGATGASVVQVVVSGTKSGSMTYNLPVVAGATLGQSLIVQFPIPIPASALNTAIVVTCPSLGAGNTHNCVNAHGLQI